ncbi:ankyrin repeat-containing protein ITN1-like [Aristolochia californica]|uniref:ankyrin repeat-containing protein ITN1-like n=1 Tax=Aristolochia californica TaxID=171875 RepID=UPI0035D53AC3
MGKGGSGEQNNEVKQPEASNVGHDLKLTIQENKHRLEITVTPDAAKTGAKERVQNILDLFKVGIREVPQTNLDELKSETPILVAARTGAKEIVEKILDIFPGAIRDVSKDGKNIVLLVVEHRQPLVFQFLTELCLKKSKFQSDFLKVDNDGNSALHLAATLGKNRPWIIPGAALQMQWEIKWYKLVKSSMQSHSFVKVNKKGQTAKEIFTETHRELVREGGDWLINTSQSCSVVAALIATVAFAAAVTVPGGNKENQGTPNLEGRPAFDMFAISSLLALCLSVTSLIMFLAILTSRHVARDFEWSLPRKLILGLTSLFFSIAAILLSFCAAHYFLLRNHLKQLVIYVYAVPCLPVALFAFAQFPLFFDLIKAVLTRVPHRTYRETVY